ncbi:hypothetical protein CR513_18153, partial [Mucuna pruriens]
MPQSKTSKHRWGKASVVSLRSGRELSQQAALQQRPRPTDAEFEPDADLLARSVPLPFPTQTLSARKPEIEEDLLKMFQKVEINIPLLDDIKQIPKYAKFLKELCEFTKQLIRNNMKFQEDIYAALQDLHLKRFGQTPSQTIPNPTEENISGKELPPYVHKRKRMKGRVEYGGIVSALTKYEATARLQQTLPKKC